MNVEPPAMLQPTKPWIERLCESCWLVHSAAPPTGDPPSPELDVAVAAEPETTPFLRPSSDPTPPALGDPQLGWTTATCDAPPVSLTASDGSGLTLTRFSANAVIHGPLAFTELHLVFYNPEPRELEGRFSVTLPDDAAISRLAMQIDAAGRRARWSRSRPHGSPTRTSSIASRTPR